MLQNLDLLSMRFSISCAILRLIAFTLSIGTVNGYILGRLITIKNNADLEPSNPSQVKFLPPYIYDTVMDNFPQILTENENNFNDFVAPTEITNKQKKAALQGGFKKSPGLLKTFAGTGSRNCFFTPIQCMIQHDMSKYKKLVDSNISIGRISRRSIPY
uniref:Uncharacterized protein n=1 Tax=Panagrolaimus sp. PS1159 TaxID=55785 RepID=A0AC35FSM5_9BILA